MIPRRRSAVEDLRTLFREVAASHPELAARMADGERDLGALLSARYAPPPGPPALVLSYARTAAQLAAAVHGGHVAEPNRNQARWLTTQTAVVLQTLESWTDGGREAPSGVAGPDDGGVAPGLLVDAGLHVGAVAQDVPRR
ncbi:hypothetical protein [Myxococcus sp. Y35]|uniref:hypothetical protein n=1 Tax=Pseudomyxococcus flavus TaxID=3115648 RepID=UPI003CEFCACE